MRRRKFVESIRDGFHLTRLDQYLITCSQQEPFVIAIILSRGEKTSTSYGVEVRALFKQKRKFMEVWHGKICVTASTAHGYGLFGFTLFVTTLLKNLHENQALSIEFL